jgi:class 3 adenylate cyclase/tetratricopeptide (TPR) repeat protein
MNRTPRTPDPFVPRHLLKRLDEGLSIKEEHALEGSFLLADLSRFTQLSESLTRTSAYGPDKLTSMVNGLFQPIIRHTLELGGSILQFAGDSILVYFPGDPESTPKSALTAAHRLFDSFRDMEPINTGAVPYDPGIKIAIDVGTARGMTVQLETDRYEYLALGNPINQLAELENELDRNSVALSAETMNTLSDTPVFTSKFFEPDEFTEDVIDNHPTETDEGPIRPVMERDDWDLLEQFSPQHITEQRRVLGEQSEWMAEVRRVTPLFINVSIGAEPDRERVEAFYRQFYQITDERGGTFLSSDLSTIGITALTLFGAPAGHEYHEDRALNSALETMALSNDFEGTLNVRIGIDSGQVLCGLLGDEHRRTYTALGDPVNTAARLMDSGGWGSVMVHEQTLTNTRDHFMGESKTLNLDGKSEALDVVDVRDRRTNQPSGTDETRLIGRGEIRDQFRDPARRDGPFLFSVTGEAGIGKTALLDDWDQWWSRQGGSVVRVSCVPHEKSAPLLTWRQALWRYFELGRDPDEETLAEAFKDVPEQDQPHLREILGFDTDTDSHHLGGSATQENRLRAIVNVINHAEDTLWMIDDAHWSDEASIDVLRRLAELEEHGEASVVMSRRPEGTPIADLPAENRWTLEGLTPDQARELAEDLLGTDEISQRELQRVHEKTEGNPLFLREIFRLNQHNQEIDEQIPGTVQDLLQARVDQLPSDQRQILRAASVIGDTFFLDLLGDISPVDAGVSELAEVMDELEAAGFVHREGDLKVTFQNALTYETVYENVPASLRQSFHEKIARTMERDLKNEDVNRPMDLIAHHYNQADIPHKAGNFYLKAGRKALARHNYSNAVHLLGLAADRYRELSDDGKRATVHHKMGDARKKLGHYSDAREDYRTAEQFYRATGKVAKSAIVRDLIGVCLQREGHHEQAVQHSREALDRLPDEPSKSVRMARAQCFNSLTVAHWYTGEYSDSIEYGKTTVEIEHELEDSIYLTHGLFSLGNSYAATCQFEQARNCFRDLLDHARRDDVRAGIAYAWDGLGVCARDTGQFNQALDYHRRSHDIRSDLGDPRGMCYSTIGLACTWLKIGHKERTRTLIEQANEEIEDTEESNLRGELKRVSGLYHLVSHNPDQAETDLTEAVETASESGFKELYVKSLSPLANVYVETDEVERARSIADDVLDEASEHDIVDYRVWAHLLTGDCDELTGRSDDAIDQWQTALEISNNHDLRPLEIQAMKRLAAGGQPIDEQRRNELVQTMAEDLNETSQNFLERQAKQLPGHLKRHSNRTPTG